MVRLRVIADGRSRSVDLLLHLRLRLEEGLVAAEEHQQLAYLPEGLDWKSRNPCLSEVSTVITTMLR